MIRQGLAEHLNQSYGERHFKHKIFQGKNLEQDIITHLGNPNLLDEDCDYLMNLLEGMEETVQNNWEDYKPGQNSKETDFYTNIFDLDGKVIIKSDKNIGYGLYTIEQVIELYQKTNEENGYVKVNITNEEYLKNISKLKAELLPEIPEWIDLKIPLRFKENLKQTEGEIAFMKILPKVHKLQTPSFETFGSLTCRTIKAGNNDPLNAISAVIGKVTKHLVKMVKIYLIRKYGFQPSVEGGDEAFERISSGKWKVEWSRSINAQGDIVNLYPSLDFKYVKIAYEKAFIIVKIDPETCQYIINGLYITMTNNVFRQPCGHFKSGGTTKKQSANGFAIGDLSAAAGSNLTLLISEDKILEKLKIENLLKNIHIYLRYMDDLKILLKGEREDMFKALKIISTGYPQILKLKMKVSYFCNNFLDMKTHHLPPSGEIQISLLRKKNNSYDVTRKSSNTTEHIKKSAMYSYCYRMHRRTNSIRDYKHQHRVNSFIFSSRGQSKKDFLDVVKEVQKKVKKQERRKSKNIKGTYIGKDKKYGGKISYDQETSSHKHIRNLIQRSKLPSHLNLPILVPGVKMEQYIFTKKKFEKKMEEICSMDQS